MRSFGHTYGFPFTITNCSNNYSPYQFPEKLIPLIINNAMKGNSLPIYGDRMQVRDCVHVMDHCQAVNLVVKKAVNGSSYNIGGDNQTTNLHIVRMVCNIMDKIMPLKNGQSYRN